LLRRFENDGRPLTYAAVASAAQVSRAWFYTQLDIRAAIERLRQVTGRTTAIPVPTRQRASEASPLRRLEVAHARNQQLTRELAELREQLAVAHADLREGRRPAGATRRD
jgi:hypothetical protein